jgi:hypothetical protein
MNGLEAQLVALGRELEVPAAPNLVPAVMERIGPRRARRRTWLLAVALVLVAALAATLAIPSARSAFLRILHIGGEEIRIVDELPPLEPAPGLDLGERVSLAEARRRVPFRVLVPEDEPDAVYFRPLGRSGEVTLLYGTLEQVKVLIMQRPGRFDSGFVKKIAARDTKVEFVPVGTASGVFLSGKPHFYFLVNEFGAVVEETVRLAKNVLIWDRGDVAYRIEGDLTREQALSLAATLR